MSFLALDKYRMFWSLKKRFHKFREYISETFTNTTELQPEGIQQFCSSAAGLTFPWPHSEIWHNGWWPWAASLSEPTTGRPGWRRAWTQARYSPWSRENKVWQIMIHTLKMGYCCCCFKLIWGNTVNAIVLCVSEQCGCDPGWWWGGAACCRGPDRHSRWHPPRSEDSASWFL